jgi:glycerol-3-phosphate cytidylyltransferase
MTKIYTGGTFDLFHEGHVNFLRKARALGDILIVALNTDEFVEQFKRKTICTFDERWACLDACRHVDLVIDNFGGSNSGLTISSVCPDIIAIGDDWKDRDYLGQLGINQKFLDDRNIIIEYLPYTKTISTTEIINRIKNA